MESENVLVVHRVPWKQGQAHWAEATVKASRNMGDPDETSNGVERS
jgi:hypothetical protein